MIKIFCLLLLFVTCSLPGLTFLLSLSLSLSRRRPRQPFDPPSPPRRGSRSNFLTTKIQEREKTDKRERQAIPSEPRDYPIRRAIFHYFEFLLTGPKASPNGRRERERERERESPFQPPLRREEKLKDDAPAASASASASASTPPPPTGRLDEGDAPGSAVRNFCPPVVPAGHRRRREGERPPANGRLSRSHRNRRRERLLRLPQPGPPEAHPRPASTSATSATSATSPSPASASGNSLRPVPPAAAELRPARPRPLPGGRGVSPAALGSTAAPLSRLLPLPSPQAPPPRPPSRPLQVLRPRLPGCEE